MNAIFRISVSSIKPKSQLSPANSGDLREVARPLGFRIFYF